MSIVRPTGFRLVSEVLPHRGPTSLTLTWDSQLDAVSYRITVAAGAVVKTVSCPTAPVTITQLASNLSYQINIVAVDAVGVVSPPAMLRAVTALPRPSAPLAALSGMTAGAPIRVSWSTHGLDFDTTNVVSVEILRQPLGGPRQLLVAEAALTGEAWDYGAAGPMGYIARLTCVHPEAPNGRNESEPSAIATITGVAFSGAELGIVAAHDLLGRLAGRRL